MSKKHDNLIQDMATALQKAVAMYCLLHDHAKGQTDLTEDQLGNVVTGVSEDASRVLERARDAGLVPPLPTPRPRPSAHPYPVRAAHVTLM